MLDLGEIKVAAKNHVLCINTGIPRIGIVGNKFYIIP